MLKIHHVQERGSMSVEVVLMMPILVLFMLLVVAGGRYVSVHADIEAAARDAARAASLERTYDDATAAAHREATTALDTYSRLSDCKVEKLGGDFKPGGIVKVTLDCEVPNDGLGLIGLHGSQSMKATGSAPLETYRRTG